jgi:beta-lactamase superfamily II metal-dependent hydrolase
MAATPAKSIRIRMYRVGFGDCFLVTLSDAGHKRQILVDCGVHPKGDIKTMEKAIDDVAAETGGRLDLIVATHRHQDHIAGFGTFAAKFQQMTAREVWLPWTENDDDGDARALKKKQLALVDGLQRHFAAAAGPRYAAVRAALLNLAGNEKSLGVLTGDMGAKVKYREAGEELKNAAGIEGLDVLVLGPPRDQAFLGRMDPPASQRYVRAAAGGASAGKGGSESSLPFSAKWEYQPDKPPLSAAEIKYFDALDAESAEALGFQLTQAVNNTSVVLLMRYAGESMLFPGDAQYGNWQSWIEKDDARQRLEEVTFFKVAHHGSENATPRGALDRMRQGKFAAMVPTQNEPWPSIPYDKILTRLDSQTGGRYLRSDSLEVKGAPKGPKLAKLPTGFDQGPLWYDCYLPAKGSRKK